MTRDLLILACDACGTATPLDLIPTAPRACRACGNYGTVRTHEAVVVRGRVEAAEVYPWTPYLAAQKATL